MYDVWAPTSYDAQLTDRRSVRGRSSGMGELTVISPRRSEKLPVKVLDVSRSGLQIEVGSRLEFGSVIELQLRTLTVFGEVTSCEQTKSRRHRACILVVSVMDSGR